MATTWPVLYRRVVFGDTTLRSTGGDWVEEDVLVGETYLEEFLEPSGAGDMLVAGAMESMTLIWAKEPVEMPFDSSESFTRNVMADGTYSDIFHRTKDNMNVESWTFHLKNILPLEYKRIRHFLRKAGNHQLLKAVDPEGRIIYGKIDGSFSVSRTVRTFSLDFTIKQIPGITSL